MAQHSLASKIERRLWNLICSGYGDGDTIRELSKSIEQLARRHIAVEQSDD